MQSYCLTKNQICCCNMLFLPGASLILMQVLLNIIGHGVYYWIRFVFWSQRGFIFLYNEMYCIKKTFCLNFRREHLEDINNLALNPIRRQIIEAFFDTRCVQKRKDSISQFWEERPQLSSRCGFMFFYFCRFMNCFLIVLPFTSKRNEVSYNTYPIMVQNSKSPLWH